RPTAPAQAARAVAPPAPPLRPPLLARSTTPAPGTRPARATPVEPPPPRAPTPPLGAKAAYAEARPPTPPPGAKAAYPEARLPTPARGAAKATPVAGLTTVPEEAVPVPIEGIGRSGRIDTSLIRTGSVSLPPRGLGLPAPPAPKLDADPRAEQYRNLFAEFVKLRKTTGESVHDLDANHFVATLREKRAQIMKQIPVKDVQFKLAFHNGKAAIRYLTVT
ncbi:MAG TPA: MXAN_5187 C-terminal domain-containing protein, partial [Polyangia bacterium]